VAADRQDAAKKAAAGESCVQPPRPTPAPIIFRRLIGRPASDAAHLVIPTGGLGMNTGVGDAIDLSWKLAEAEFGDDDGWIKFGLVHNIIVLFNATPRIT